jgi:HSP20 family protein
MSIVKFRNGNNRNSESRNTQGIVPGLSSWPSSLLEDFATPAWSRDLMQDFFNDNFLSGVGRIGTTLPAVNITETADDVVIEMAAPGMKKNDFKVEVDNDQLHISYAKEKKDEDTTQRNHWRREYNFESFDRTFTLPATVETEKLYASYNDGILKISVPKKEEARKKPARTINVQ